MGITNAKRLGELLVEKGLITPKQLDQALERQRSTREFLGAILISGGWVGEERLLRSVADQFEVSFIRMEEEWVDWDVVLRFLEPLIVEHRCIPLRMDAGEVLG